MGDDGKALAGQRGKGEDAADGGQFLTTVTTHNASLAEQGLDSRVAAGNGSCVGRGSPTATLRRTRLDGCYATTLADELRGVVQQLVGIADVLDIQQLDG